MAITLHIGSWALPLAVTLAAFALAIWWANNQAADNGLFPLGGLFAAMFLLPLAAIVSLAAWLAWALIV